MYATISQQGDGALGEATRPNEQPEQLQGDSEQAVRKQVIRYTAKYASWVGRPVRLVVTDSQATWPLVVDGEGNVTPDGAPDHTTSTASPPAELHAVEPPEWGQADQDSHAIESQQPDWMKSSASTQSDEPSGSAWSPPSTPRASEPGSRRPVRSARHEHPKGRWAAVLETISRQLKDRAELHEEALDAQLAKRHRVSEPNKIAVVSPKGGPGKTTIAVVLGDVLASRLPDHQIAALDFNPGGGALAAVAADDRRAERTMLELHDGRGEITSHAHLQEFVASLPSGLELLAVPPEPGLALKITPQHYAELFSDVLEPNYTGLVLDTSPDITTPVTQFALDRATQMVIVVEQGYVASGVVTNALPYLLERPAAGSDGSLATVVINKVMSDPRAGSVQTLRDEIHNINEHLTIIEVPWDLDLRSQIDAGTYTLDSVRQRSTRVPLKELALAVMERFV